MCSEADLARSLQQSEGPTDATNFWIVGGYSYGTAAGNYPIRDCLGWTSDSGLEYGSTIFGNPQQPSTDPCSNANKFACCTYQVIQ